MIELRQNLLKIIESYKGSIHNPNTAAIMKYRIESELQCAFLRKEINTIPTVNITPSNQFNYVIYGLESIFADEVMSNNFEEYNVTSGSGMGSKPNGGGIGSGFDDSYLSGNGEGQGYIINTYYYLLSRGNNSSLPFKENIRKSNNG
jgi:hypothetical protein